MSTAKVYIGGGGDESPDVGETDAPFDVYLSKLDEWSFVRANANGYYVTNYALYLDDLGKCLQEPKLRKMAEAFTNRSVFYETDIRDNASSEFKDKRLIDILRYFFNEVSYATLNSIHEKMDDLPAIKSRIAALQWRYPRPVLAMQAPWKMSGSINNSGNLDADAGRLGISLSSGSATDGPMGMWAYSSDGFDGMHQASASIVKYAHAEGKVAMVMIAPFDNKIVNDPNSRDTTGEHFDARGQEFLRRGQDCVRFHEANGAAPDVWVISYYASAHQPYPVTPEQVNGAPAGTITGLAYWLINHLRDPRGVFA